MLTPYMVSAECQVQTDDEVVSRVRAGETCLYELLMRGVPTLRRQRTGRKSVTYTL